MMRLIKVHREECEGQYVDSPAAWLLSILYWGWKVAVGDYKLVTIWAQIGFNFYAEVDGVQLCLREVRVWIWPAWGDFIVIS